MIPLAQLASECWAHRSGYAQITHHTIAVSYATVHYGKPTPIDRIPGVMYALHALVCVCVDGPNHGQV